MDGLMDIRRAGPIDNQCSNCVIEPDAVEVLMTIETVSRNAQLIKLCSECVAQSLQIDGVNMADSLGQEEGDGEGDGGGGEG